jgi:hypothetical protein
LQHDASSPKNKRIKIIHGLIQHREFRAGWPCVRKLQNAGRALHAFLNKDDAAAKASTDTDNASPTKGIDFAGSFEGTHSTDGDSS